MAFILGCNFNIPHYVFLDGIAQCKEYGQPSWITKCVILTYESRVDVCQGESVTVLM